MHLAAAAGQKATCVKLLQLDVRSLNSVILLLFQAHIDPNDDLEQKPIHLAAQNDHTNLVQLFLENR